MIITKHCFGYRAEYKGLMSFGSSYVQAIINLIKNI